MKRNVQVAAAMLASAMLACFGARAQTPGGVSPAAWYRADAPGSVFSDAGTTAASNNATVQQWNDLAGSGRNLIQASANARPVFSNSSALANFNPSVTFDGSNDFLQFTAGAGVNVIDRANGSIYTAGQVNTMKQSGFAGFHASMDYPGLHIFGSNNKLLFFTGGPGYQGLSNSSLTAGMFFTAGSGWQNGAGTNASYAAATVSLNGTRSDYNGSQLYNANLSTGARDFRIGADNNYGAFSGQLNEVMVFEDKLTVDQMDRLETYLAVKYGTTYANGTRDYKNSAGSVVWSASTNAGLQNNIAGIGRDDNGALHQKQSWSTNTGLQVLIGTGTLSNTNLGNAASLANGQFLVWGDNGLARTPNVAITGISGISHRFASVWKVQNTGNVGTVRVAWVKNLANLSLIQSADNVFDASDALTNMSANEVTINGVVFNYADVTLSNGQYFTFAAKVAAPGGVSGPAVWLKADQGTTLTGSSVSGWVNYGNSGGVAGQLGRTSTLNWALPKYGANEHNFNPAIIDDVPATNDGSLLLADVFPEPGQRALSSFILHSRDNVSNSENNMIAFTPLKITSGALEAPYMAGYRGNRPWFYWQGPYENAPVLPNSLTRINNIPSVNGFYVPQWVSGTPHQTTVSMNGATATTPAYNINATSYPFGNQLFIFGDGNANNWSGGKISEVITYDKLLTDTEKLQVNSYLSIKYGITLNNNGGTAVPNYLNSSAAIVWDATANAGYTQNVAGIANDVESTLNQKQSKSVNAGQQVLIATTGLANTNAANGTSLGNGQYLIWGDNGLAKVPAIAVAGVAGVNFRFGAVWKVQNTGSVGNVRVTWPSGLTNLTLLQSSDNTFATVTTATNMSGNTTTVNGVSYNYADVTLADGQYFTFATQLNGPGGVALNLRVWLRSDAGFAPDSWADLSGNANNYTQTNESRQPFVASKLYNFNPAVDFGGSASADGRFMVTPTGKPFTSNGLSGTFFTATVTRNGGTSGYRDIWGFGGTTTGSGLVNANEPTITKLNNNLVLYSSITSAFNDQYLDNKFILSDMSYTVNVAGIKYGFNGTVNSTTQTRTTGGSQQANGSVLGSQPEVTNGVIGEAIAFERDLSEAEKQRVRSYIAIKYGVTLPHNYIAANNTTVFWDQTVNTGYNKNIAGIARDDQGSLSQKQSWSINSSKEVLIGTTGLADDNASNATLLSDQQFLVWGDNGLAKAPGISLGTIGGLPYNRFAAIWKVQNTASVGTVRVAWPKGYANLKLVRSSDATIDLSDVVTEMSNTVTIGGKEYAYADVTLDNGSFFTFAAFVQGPGGVTNNLTHWYRADYNVESQGEGTDASEWADFNGGVIVTQLGDSDMPKFKVGASDYFNFNPGVNFTSSNQTLGNIALPTVSAQQYDIFTLTKEGLIPGGNGRVFSSLVSGTDLSGSINYWDGIGIMADNRIERMNTAYNFRYLANPGNINWASNAPSIMYNTFTNTTVAKGLNGAANGSTATHTAIGSLTGGHAIGSTQFSSNGSDNAGFTGHIGELIIYGAGNVSGTDRNKVDSYLAIKYGVTLAAGTNYTTSSDAVVWDATANATYHNNVGGIGNDFRSALNQKQSRSQHTNTNNQVTIGLGGIAATNQTNASQLADGQFLIWGDNGNTQAMTNTASTYTQFVYSGSINNARRMNRIWKVQNTNVSGETLIRFPQASVGTTTLTNDACAGYVILFASDAAFSSNVTAVPVTLNGTDYEGNYTFPNGASYFTFGKVTPITTGTVYLPAVTEETTQYVDNCATGEWTYFRNSSDASLKLFATTNLSATVLNNLTVKITPEGVTYADGVKSTSLMPRITTVTDASGTPFTGAKVRVYYSASELAATQLPGALVNGWFKYEGTAEDVISNIYGSGTLESAKAVQLTPNASGVENGVNYVEFHNISSFSSFVYLSTTAESALPVTLTYFKAAKEAGIANLAWATTEETNNKGFEILRSSDARNWNAIGFVNAQTNGGNNKGILTYDFKDESPLAGTNYYRLKQIDIDGSFAFSSIAALYFEGSKGMLLVYPNPVVNGSLTLGLPQTGSYKLSVYNVAGMEVLNATQSGNTLDVRNLRAGVYVLRVVYPNGTAHNKTFVVK